MDSASILVKPASADCNIACSYCFYQCLSRGRQEYSKGRMSPETMKQVILRAYEYVDRYVSFAFQGGEPMLAGLDFFRRTVEMQKRYNTKGLLVENTLQTNGLLLDEEWAEFLRENRFLVGLSLDGPASVHDRCRRDASGAPTFDRVMRAAKLLDRHQVPFNILSVVTEPAAKEASALYDFYRENGFHYLQFIPCMDEPVRQAGTHEADLTAAEAHEPAESKSSVMQAGAHNPYAVTPESYGIFLCEMFDRWYADFEGVMDGTSDEEPTDIRWFSNLAQVDAGYPAEECGMNGSCFIYFVAEGDGSIYPCDFYCMDEYRLGTVEESFRDLLHSERAVRFVRESLAVDEKCRRCPHFSLCKGGCKRWRDPLGSGRPGLNYLCPAYEMFFEHAKERIHVLGSYIRRKYPG